MNRCQSSTPDDWQSFLQTTNFDRQACNLLRVPRVLIPGASALKADFDQGTSNTLKLTLFSTNDYLGLSSHPDVKQAISAAALQHGNGPRASAIVSGHTSLHEDLELRLSILKHSEACMLFPTGFGANMATISALASGSEVDIFSDALNHACLIDGCRLAARQGAQLHVFRHHDYSHLQQLLDQAVAAKEGGRLLVVTDGVFSMDGDVADLSALAQLKQRYGFLLMVDDAHGTLALGAFGGGIGELTGTCHSIDVHTGTLSKAVGSIGGFVACSAPVKTYLVNTARGYTFSTALPVPAVAAAIAALDVFHRESWRSAHLEYLQHLVEEGLGQPCPTPIIPVIVGSADRAVRVSGLLWQRGFHVPAIRPPTVPDDSSRLRISLSAEHSVADVCDMLQALRECLELPSTLQCGRDSPRSKL